MSENINYQQEYQKLLEKYNKLKKSKEIIVDVSNEDNLKTVMQLMSEGKILITKKEHEPFILAEQKRSPYDGAVNKVIHKIFINDISMIMVKRYYEDYEVTEKNRTLIKTTIFCYHNGALGSSVIDNDNLLYLVQNKLIKEDIIKYSDVDISTGRSFMSKPYALTNKEVKSEIARRNELYKKQHSIKEDDVNEEETIIDLKENNKKKETTVKKSVGVEDIEEGVETPNNLIDIDLDGIEV